MTLLYEGQVLAFQSVEQIQQLHRLLEVERVVPAESLALLQSEDGLGWTGGQEEAGPDPHTYLDIWWYRGHRLLTHRLLLLSPVFRGDSGQELTVHGVLPEDILQVVDVGF